MYRPIAMLMTIFTLVACGPQAEAPAPKQKIVVQSDAQKAMHGLNELSRAIALKRALHDTGAQCLRIIKSGYVGPYENTEQWTATCEDKFKRTRDWALYIGADDNVQVRLCSDVVKAGLPGCVIKGEAAPVPAAGQA